MLLPAPGGPATTHTGAETHMNSEDRTGSIRSLAHPVRYQHRIGEIDLPVLTSVCFGS